jgi:hypothetical protein
MGAGLGRIRCVGLPIIRIHCPTPIGSAGEDAHSTGSFMPCLIHLVAANNWAEIHAVLDRRKGDVNDRDPVRAARTFRSQHVATPTAPHLSLR